MKTIRLREGKERSLLRRHPWVYAGSIARGKADAGETVRVEAHDGRVRAENRAQGGARFVITLPAGSPPDLTELAHA